MSCKIIFTETNYKQEDFFPFTHTRKIQDVRIGILSLREKWEKLLWMKSCDDSLSSIAQTEKNNKNESWIILPGNLLPSASLCKAILKLENGSFIANEKNQPIAFRVSKNEILPNGKIKKGKRISINFDVHYLTSPLDIILQNDASLRFDFNLITKGRKSIAIPKYVKTKNPSKIFIENGARLEHCILNASVGPIYIGKNSLIMDGAVLRGSVAIGDESVVKSNATIYGATTVGTGCVVGGEVKNSVFFDYSNKVHHGYIGDSIIGSYCNLGAGTSNSNIKNNASKVKLKFAKGIVNTGAKCGMFMGDYSRTAINTSINTGTVIGVCCNIFDSGLTPKSISNFSWGNFAKYDLLKAFADIGAWKKMKKQKITKEEKENLKYIFENY